jgi:hypothetical protein
MNISSRKRLKVALRRPPFSPWAKETEACPRSFGEGNSFEEGSEQRGCSLLVTVRKRIAPPPAAPKLNVKVSLHSATQCMVVVIDALCGHFRVPRIMAMSVESELVAQFFSASLTFGRDVIYFYEIFWSEE